jgi:hypothetical protein
VTYTVYRLKGPANGSRKTRLIANMLLIAGESPASRENDAIDGGNPR